ncbi:MAG TPA: MFS transporter [Terracidiphilus sp.]|nr:MFS transporter [Terracidiphilus sp.]
MRIVPIRAWLVFWIFVLSAIAFLDRTNLSIAGPEITREFRIDNIHLGWVISAFLIGYAASQVFAGWISVRLGPRKALTLGVLWWGLFTLSTALVPPGIRGALWLLIAVRFALGIGEAIVYPASNQFVARWIPASERGIANGVIFAGVGAGAGLTPPLLTAIISGHGWRAAFWFSAIAGVIAGVIWFFIARDAPQEHPLISAGELGRIETGIAIAPATVPGKARVPWGAILGSRTLLLLTFSYFGFVYVAWIFLGWFYMYMAQARGLDLKASAIYTMFPFLAITVCCPIGGLLVDWISSKHGMRAGRCGVGVAALLLTAILLVIGSRFPGAQAAAMTLAASAGTLYLCQSSYWSVAADIAGEHAGIASAVMNMGGQIGGAVTASLTPWIAQKAGWTSSFLVAGLIAAAGAIAWLGVNPEKQLLNAVPELSATEDASRAR